MQIKTESTSLRLARSMAIGVLLSMLFFYGIHVFGTWEIANHRPDSQTTNTVLLHNKCAVIGDTHTLRPNTEVPAMDDGINGTKLSGSFMNFTNGHVGAMVIFSLLAGGAIFAGRHMIKKNQKREPDY